MEIASIRTPKDESENNERGRARAGRGTHEDQIESPVIPRIYDKFQILQIRQTIPILLGGTCSAESRTSREGPGPESGDLGESGTEEGLELEVLDEFGLTDADVSLVGDCGEDRVGSNVVEESY